jgi:plastocyanin
MDRMYRDTFRRTLGVSRSRRRLIGTAAKGTLGGVGAAMLGWGLGPGKHIERVSGAASAQAGTCPATGDVFVRRNIYELDPEGPEIASLRRGVAEMMRRSEVKADDPTGWLFQADLHAVPAILEPEPIWCQHLSWFFFPWHRMYLFWFERILRDASGDPTLTLPYWNYSDDEDHRKLPQVFRDQLDPDGNPNPLYTPRRNAAINHPTTPVSLTADGVSYEDAFNDLHIRFFPDPVAGGVSFGGNMITEPANRGTGMGELEATPHGDVHVEVGSIVDPIDFGQQFFAAGTVPYHCDIHSSMTGTIEIVEDDTLEVRWYEVRIIDNAFVPQNVTIPVTAGVFWTNMDDSSHTATADDTAPTDLRFDSGTLSPAGLMLLPQLAARDPIFWLHHCNIDRLWERWLAQKGGRTNPLGEVEWMDQPFTFYDIDGSEQPLIVSQTVDIAGCLGYRYDDPDTQFTLDEPPPEAAGGVDATPAAAAQVTVLGESASDQPIELIGDRVTSTIALAPPAEEAVTEIVSGIATPGAELVPPQIVLNLEGMRYQGGPLDTYEVYVNLPANVAPDPNGEYFVGTIYLFGLLLDRGHHMPGEGVSQSFAINRIVEGLQERGEWQGDPVVTYVRRRPAMLPDSAATPPPEAATPDEATLGPTIRIERETLTAVGQ